MRSVCLTIPNISRFSFTVVAVFFQLTAHTQENSPFSRYGLGEYYSNQHIISRSIGGLTAAYSDVQSVNFSNPATYSNFFMTTFDIGLSIDSRTLRSRIPEGKATSSNFYPAYLSVGLPLNRAKGWGAAFGLKPLSRISYSVENRARVAGDSLQTLYDGSGGLNEAFIGIGKKWKGLSIGINTGYHFGRKQVETQKNFINDSVHYYSSKSVNSTNFSGIFLGYGIQYDIMLTQKVNDISKTTEAYKLLLGFSGTLKQNMKASQTINRYTFAPTAYGEAEIDSIWKQTDLGGTVSVPSSYAAGITLHKTTANARGVFELWSIGAEYTRTQWTKYRFYGSPDNLANSWQLKLGGQFTPDPLSMRSYWNLTTYRAGIYIGQDYLNPDGKGLQQFGISFGMGLPVRKWSSFNDQFTVLNTALQFGKRGSSVNNVTENYLQFSVGVSLSDIWFVKRRYD